MFAGDKTVHPRVLGTNDRGRYTSFEERQMRVILRAPLTCVLPYNRSYMKCAMNRPIIVNEEILVSNITVLRNLSPNAHSIYAVV
jgi:hypothetical protein